MTTGNIAHLPIASYDEWLAARKELLAREQEITAWPSRWTTRPQRLACGTRSGPRPRTRGKAVERDAATHPRRCERALEVLALGRPAKRRFRRPAIEEQQIEGTVGENLGPIRMKDAHVGAMAK